MSNNPGVCAKDFIAAEGVERIYNSGRPDEVHALREVSLSVTAGELTVLSGPSGSGKSSLLSLLGCMARPTAGRILIQGRDVVKLPEHFLTDIRRKTFGFIFQQFHLIRELSVQENVLLPLFPLPVGLSQMRRRVEEILDHLGLAARSRHKVRQLSGGEQQRVAIARALINNPPVLIADEPTAHLDRQLAREFLEIVGGLREEGRTVIIASHDPLVCEDVRVDRRIRMCDGRIIRQEGP